MKTILLQGDSITDAGRIRGDENLLGFGYAMFTKAKLDFEQPGAYQIFNRGIGGNRIADLYARMKSDIIDLKPDYLSILIGVNDVWHENGVTVSEYYNIYDQLIAEILEALPNIKIMIMEPFVLKGLATEERWELFSADVSKVATDAKKIAEKYKLHFVPLQDKFNKAAERVSCKHWLKDGVHPTPAGDELLAREWLQEFEKMVTSEE